ncbi:MAG: VOC family protein, partial [Aquabacterium sp.]
MDLGAFSISLAVKDIAASRDFYEKLGFTVFGGDQAQRWLIMKSGTTLIGLFQGMFEKNMLTFNPGWDSDAKNLPDFVDVRRIEETLAARGIPIGQRADPATVGPAYIT